MTSMTADVEVLERERARLEGLLEADANWRMLQDIASERNIEQFAAMPDRAELIRSLETVLSTNRYFLARRKIMEAIELLRSAALPPRPAHNTQSSGAEAPPIAPSPEIAAAVSRAQRLGIANRMVMLEALPTAAEAFRTTLTFNHAAERPAAPPDGQSTSPASPVATAFTPDAVPGGLANFSRPEAPRRSVLASCAVAWPQSDSARAQQAHDNFALLRGIDAWAITRLHGAGVTRFAAIAAWTTTDVARMRDVLANGGQIAREGWIEQAAVLATGRDTSYARLMKRGEATSLVPQPIPHEGEPGDFARLSYALVPLAIDATVPPIASRPIPAEDAPRLLPGIPPALSATAGEPFLILADHDAIRLDGIAAIDAPAIEPLQTLAASEPAPVIGVAAAAAPIPPAPAPLLSTPVIVVGEPNYSLADVVSMSRPAAPPTFGTPAPFERLIDARPLLPTTRQEPPLPHAGLAVPAAEETTMQRLARLEQGLAELDAAGPSLQSRLAHAVASTPGSQHAAFEPATAPPRPPARADRPLRNIEDDEFPELHVGEADVAIVPNRRIRPANQAGHRTTDAMLRRQRQAEQQPLEASSYAGYQTEIEEATVEIVKHMPSPAADVLAGSATAEPLAEVRASKASVQRFLKTLGSTTERK